MNAKTLKALRGSIAKWQAIVDGTGIDDGHRNCPLCTLFLHQDDECSGCPVKEQTRFSNCHYTPYRDYVETPTKANAKAELRFLKSLLPEGK